jgi:hypothetical protein
MISSVKQESSSNHSSSYVIVGKFDTAAQSIEAAEAFKTLLRKIWAWYQAHDDVREVVLYGGEHELTGAERDVMAEYPIEFTEAIDWLAREDTDDFLSDAVIRFENYLFVATVDETETKDAPFAQYMKKLGAKLVFEESMRVYLTVEFRAKPPDQATADFIKSSVDTFLMRDHNILWQRPPWVLFHGGKLPENPEDLSRDIDLFIANYQAWRNWHSENRQKLNDLTEKRDYALRTGDTESGERLQAEVSAILSSQVSVKPKIDKDLEQKIAKIMSNSSPMLQTKPEEVTFKNNVLIFPLMDFLPDNYGHGITTIVMWLRSLGCVDVQYKFLTFPSD